MTDARDNDTSVAKSAACGEPGGGEIPMEPTRNRSLDDFPCQVKLVTPGCRGQIGVLRAEGKWRITFNIDLSSEARIHTICSRLEEQYCYGY